MFRLGSSGFPDHEPRHVASRQFFLEGVGSDGEHSSPGAASTGGCNPGPGKSVLLLTEGHLIKAGVLAILLRCTA